VSESQDEHRRGNWTQAICHECWPAWCLSRGEVPFEPSILTERSTETCCACGSKTKSGIYTRLDPKIGDAWKDINYGYGGRT